MGFQVLKKLVHNLLKRNQSLQTVILLDHLINLFLGLLQLASTNHGLSKALLLLLSLDHHDSHLVDGNKGKLDERLEHNEGLIPYYELLLISRLNQGLLHPKEVLNRVCCKRGKVSLSCQLVDCTNIQSLVTRLEVQGNEDCVCQRLVFFLDDMLPYIALRLSLLRNTG